MYTDNNNDVTNKDIQLANIIDKALSDYKHNIIKQKKRKENIINYIESYIYVILVYPSKYILLYIKLHT